MGGNRVWVPEFVAPPLNTKRRRGALKSASTVYMQSGTKVLPHAGMSSLLLGFTGYGLSVMVSVQNRSVASLRTRR